MLRRSKCYDNLGQVEKAKADLDRLLLLEPANTEAKSILKIIQVKLDDVTFNQYREEANEFLKKKQF